MMRIHRILWIQNQAQSSSQTIRKLNYSDKYSGVEVCLSITGDCIVIYCCIDYLSHPYLADELMNYCKAALRMQRCLPPSNQKGESPKSLDEHLMPN